MTLLRNEKEIISRWPEAFKKPVVSICCIAFNQERYIEDALKGFLIQETDFPFEIIVHDDASTDNTPCIIKQFENTYPHIIKPIYQSVNQYSQGKRPLPNTFKQATGKYLSVCEGDDYWTDPRKLQMQVEAMERHPECNLSFHPALVKYDDNSHKDKLVCQHDRQERIFSFEDVILGGGGFMPTCSLMFTHKLIEKLPDWSQKVPVGDLVIQIYGASRNGALFLPDCMAVYRKAVVTSWSSKISASLKKMIVHNHKINNFYKLLESEHPEYSRTIKKKLFKNNYELSKKCFRMSHYCSGLKFLFIALNYLKSS